MISIGIFRHRLALTNANRGRVAITAAFAFANRYLNSMNFPSRYGKHIRRVCFGATRDADVDAFAIRESTSQLNELSIEIWKTHPPRVFWRNARCGCRCRRQRSHPMVWVSQHTRAAHRRPGLIVTTAGPRRIPTPTPTSIFRKDRSITPRIF